MANLRCSKKVISLSVVGAAALVIVIVLLVVLLRKGNESPTSSTRVTVEQGELEGEWMEAPTGDGFKFVSFRGIPYAQPPTGQFRFRAPRPAAKWEGVRQAKSEGPVCVQQSQGGGFIGSEDCLHLSVFSPQLPDTGKELLPVVVIIHGGAWLFGDNLMSDFGPEYLLHEEVVVATFQYRLNAYGFLSLDTEEIPGNAAIKDMVAAFEWIHKNIEKFGGDPNKITIMGQSAGSASAHWLAQLPQLKGKIQRAIIMSGSAYHNWAFTDKNLDIAQKLGQKLSKTTSFLSLPQLTDLFINSPAKDFGSAAAEFGMAQTLETQPDLPYSPTLERRPIIENGEPRIITKDAESFFINREVDPIPTIMGVTNREWTPSLYPQISLFNETVFGQRLDDYLSFLIPKNIVPWRDTQELLHPGTYQDPALAYPEIKQKIRKEYFESTNSSCDLHCKAYLYGDNVMIQTDTNRWAQYRAQNYPDVPVYLYRFSLTSEYNPISVPGFSAPFAGHTSDLFHVMRYSQFMKQDYSGSTIGSVTIRRMTKMFGNFIKYGNPVPQADALLPVAWDPNRSSQSRVTLLDIDEQLTLRHEELPGEHMDFWNDLYTQYRKSGPQAP